MLYTVPGNSNPLWVLGVTCLIAAVSGSNPRQNRICPEMVGKDSLRRLNMDIDFVVLWVDGSDPVWQAEKAKYQGKTLDDSNAPNRFRDWG